MGVDAELARELKCLTKQLADMTRAMQNLLRINTVILQTLLDEGDIEPDSGQGFGESDSLDGDDD